MENDFLDGIDEAFQRLMSNGTGKRDGQTLEERLVAEIVDHLHRLDRTQHEAVLKFILSLEKKKVG